MKRDSGKYKLKRCTEEDLTDILSLQEDIFSSLQDQKQLRYNTADMFLHCVHEPNLTLGVYDEEKLIAAAVTVDERGTDEDLNRDLVTCKPEKGANFKLIPVRDGYRGSHLQYILMRICEQYMYKRGYTHFSTTVSPDNTYSERNIRDLGYVLDHRAVKYGGMERNVYVKKLAVSDEDYCEVFLLGHQLI